MDILLSKSKSSFSNTFIKTSNYFIEYRINATISEKEIFYENENVLILGEVNPSFKNAISLQNYSLETIENELPNLNNGYIIYIEKKRDSIFIFNDIYGFFHLFYSIVDGKNIFISTDFKSLLSYSKKDVDCFSLLDILLFNYTLFDRTFVADIKRVIGGTKIELKGTSFELIEYYNFANNFKKSKIKSKISYKNFGETLINGIKKEIIQNVPINLTMSGGFDSRALLASCNRLGLKVNAFTFGQEGNIEIEIIKPFIDQFVENHSFFKLDDEYSQNIEKTFYSFLLKNLDNPSFHSLIEYQHSNERIEPSNLIVGFMGGELIIGQPIGSQVTFTKFAADLLLSKEITTLEKKFNETIATFDFINSEYVKSISTDYLETLKPYLFKEDNSNTLRFIVNEEFSKFFGAANKVFRKNNLITPFMSVPFLNLLLNSKISFLKKKQFQKTPITNFKSKILYAKAIYYLNPKLGSTKFDRLYRVKDLCKIHLFPFAVFPYLSNHLHRKNKKMYVSTTRYDLWYKNIVLSNLNYKQNELEFFKPEFSLNSDSYDKSSLLRIKVFLKGMSILKVNDMINKIP